MTGSVSPWLTLIVLSCFHGYSLLTQLSAGGAGPRLRSLGSFQLLASAVGPAFPPESKAEASPLPADSLEASSDGAQSFLLLACALCLSPLLEVPAAQGLPLDPLQVPRGTGVLLQELVRELP